MARDMLGRKAVVTGAASGIGAAAVARLLADGCTVLAVDLAADGLAGTHNLATDVANAEAIAAEAQAKLGGCDILINNAGVFFDHPIESSTYEVWQKAWADTLGVNLTGAANVSWCALQHMPRHGDSRIVNVGSRGAFRGEPVSPAYGASKAAIVAFGQSIAKALAPEGIGVTTLAPGFVDTEMAAELLDGPTGDDIRNQSPFGRVAEPDELARAIYFLASKDSLWASGAVLDFNGASYLRM